MASDYDSVAKALSDGTERKFLICDENLSAGMISLKKSIVSTEITFSAVICNIKNGEEAIVNELLEKMNEAAVGGFFSHEIKNDSVICIFTERFVTGDFASASKKKFIEDLLNIGVLNLKNAMITIEQKLNDLRIRST